jgi:DNA-binding NtrC family response regulator
MVRPIVIVLEDDEISMSVFRNTLQFGGYECIEASRLEQAVRQCLDHSGTVKALIADLVLPNCRGTEVALELAKIKPGLPVLFVSGTPIEVWEQADLENARALPRGSYTFLEKPFKARDLLQKLGALTGRSNLQTA